LVSLRKSTDANPCLPVCFARVSCPRLAYQ
jgi:hypothetical protein